MPVQSSIPLGQYLHKHAPLEMMTCLDLQKLGFGLQELPNVTIDCNIPVLFQADPQDALHVATLREQQVSMANSTRTIRIRRYRRSEPNDAVDAFPTTRLHLHWQPTHDLDLPRPGYNIWRNLVELNIDARHAGVWGAEDQPAVPVVLTTFGYPVLERLCLTGVKPNLLRALNEDENLFSDKSFPKLAFIAVEIHEDPRAKGQDLLESLMERQQRRGRFVEPRLKIVFDNRKGGRKRLAVKESLVASLTSLSILFGDYYPAEFSPSLEYHQPVFLPNVRSLEVHLTHTPHSAQCLAWLFDILKCPDVTDFTVSFAVRAYGVAVVTGNLHKLSSMINMVMKWTGLGHEDDPSEIVYLQERCKFLGVKLTIVDEEYDPNFLPI